MKRSLILLALALFLTGVEAHDTGCITQAQWEELQQLQIREAQQQRWDYLRQKRQLRRIESDQSWNEMKQWQRDVIRQSND